MELVETLLKRSGGPWEASIKAASTIVSGDQQVAFIPHRIQLCWDFVVGPALRKHRQFGDPRYWVLVETLLQRAVFKDDQTAASRDIIASARAKIKPQLIQSFMEGVSICFRDAKSTSVSDCGAAAVSLDIDLIKRMHRCFVMFCDGALPAFDDVLHLLAIVCQSISEMPRYNGEAKAEGSLERPEYIADAVLNMLRSCCSAAIKSYRANRNSKKAFGTTCSKLLPALLLVKKSLELRGYNEAGCSVASVLDEVLFASEHMEFYRDAVGARAIHSSNDISDEQVMKKRKGKEGGEFHPRSYPRQLFEKLQELFSHEKYRAAILAELPRFTSAFLGKSSSAFGSTLREVQFSVLQAILASISVTLQETSFNTMRIDVLNTLNQILAIVCVQRMYNETDDNASGASQAKWFTKLASLVKNRILLIDTSREGDTQLHLMLDVLTKLMDLNHMFIEPILPSLWNVVWHHPQICIQFCERVIVRYGELRQIDVFLMGVFESASSYSPEREGGEFGFPSEVLDVFARQVAQLPDGQRLSIWGLFMDEICKIKDQRDRSSKKRKLEGRTKSRDLRWEQLKFVSDLFHVFLLHVAILPHNLDSMENHLAATYGAVGPLWKKIASTSLAIRTLLHIQYALTEVSFLVWRVAGQPPEGPILHIDKVIQLSDNLAEKGVQKHVLRLKLQSLRLLSANEPSWHCMVHLTGGALDNLRKSTVSSILIMLEESTWRLPKRLNADIEERHISDSKSDIAENAAWELVLSQFVFFTKNCTESQKTKLAMCCVCNLLRDDQFSCMKTKKLQDSFDIFYSADVQELESFNLALYQAGCRVLVICLDKLSQFLIESKDFISEITASLANEFTQWNPELSCACDSLERSIEVCNRIIHSAIIISASESTLRALGETLVLVEKAASKLAMNQFRNFKARAVAHRCWAVCRELLQYFAASNPRVFVYLMCVDDRSFHRLSSSILRGGDHISQSLENEDSYTRLLESTAGILQHFFRTMPQMNNTFDMHRNRELVSELAERIRGNVHMFLEANNNIESCPGIVLLRSVYSGLSVAAKLGRSRIHPNVKGYWQLFTNVDDMVLSSNGTPSLIWTVATLVRLSTSVGEGQKFLEHESFHELLNSSLKLFHESLITGSESQQCHASIDFMSSILENSQPSQRIFNKIIAVLISALSWAEEQEQQLGKKEINEKIEHVLRVGIKHCSDLQYDSILDHVQLELLSLASGSCGIISGRIKTAVQLLNKALDETAPGHKLAQLLNLCIKLVPHMIAFLQVCFLCQEKGYATAIMTLNAIRKFLLKCSWSLSPSQCNGMIHLISTCNTRHIIERDRTHVLHHIELHMIQMACMDALLKRHTKSLAVCIASTVSFINFQMDWIFEFVFRKHIDCEKLVPASRALGGLLVQFATLPGAGKHSPYILADFVTGLQSKVIDARIKIAMLPGIHALFGVCGHFEKSLVGTVVKEGAKDMFRELVEDFELHFKYTGQA